MAGFRAESIPECNRKRQFGNPGTQPRNSCNNLQ